VVDSLQLLICLFVCLFVFVYMQSAEQVTLFCRQQIEYSDDEEPKPSIHLSQAQKLRKVIIELVNTERSYVKVSNTFNCSFLRGVFPLRLAPTRWFWLWRTRARSTLVNKKSGWFTDLHRAQHTQYSVHVFYILGHYHMSAHIISFLPKGKKFFSSPRKYERLVARLKFTLY